MLVENVTASDEMIVEVDYQRKFLKSVRTYTYKRDFYYIINIRFSTSSGHD